MTKLSFSRLDKKDWFVFFIGLFMVVKIRIIGTFSLAEVFLLLSYFSGRVLRCWKDRNVRWLMVFAFLWIIGTIVANYSNDIEKIDFIKGVFFKLLFLLLISPIYNLVYDKPERLLLFFIGMGISGIWAPDFAQTEAVAEMWSSAVYRFYAYFGLVSAISYYLYFKGWKKFAILIMEITSIIGLFNASRNVFLTVTIAAILLLVFNRRNGSQWQNVAYFKKNLLYYLFVGILSLYLVDVAYETAASKGILGQAAYEKYENQVSEGNLLRGGRAEFFMGIELIKMKPIVGWGSYAKDTWGFRWRYSVEHNQPFHGNESSDEYDGLPGHSYIVGSWMSSGIFGGLFWIYILIVIWKVFKSGCMLYEPRLFGLLMFQLMALLWAIFFSPFGERVQVLFFVITLLVIYDFYIKGIYQSQRY